MKIKGLLAGVSLLALTVFSVPAQAMVVTDPGAYVRMAQQLQEMQNLLEQAKAQIAQLQTMNSSLSGNNFRGSGFDQQLGETKGIVSELSKTMTNFTLPDDVKVSSNKPSEISTMLDHIYMPPSTMKGGDMSAEMRDKYNQLALKSSLEYSESLINSQQDTFGKINDLARQINQTSTSKDAQDLTNRMLAELVVGQQKQTLILAEMSRAEASAKYIGTKSDEQVKPKIEDKYERTRKLFENGHPGWRNPSVDNNAAIQETRQKLWGRKDPFDR